MWFEIRWEVCEVLSCFFVAFNVKLSFTGEVFCCCVVVLVAFYVSEDNGYGYSSYGLVDFVAEIVVVGYGSRGVGCCFRL